MVTRSPFCVQRSAPPRRDNCRASIVFLPRRSAQYGVSVQCEEPVTGSSGTPCAGAKKRETKSVPCVAGRRRDRRPAIVHGGKRGEIRLERGDVGGAVINDEIIAGAQNCAWLSAERIEQTRRRLGRHGGA